MATFGSFSQLHGSTDGGRSATRGLTKSTQNTAASIQWHSSTPVGSSSSLIGRTVLRSHSPLGITSQLGTSLFEDTRTPLYIQLGMDVIRFISLVLSCRIAIWYHIWPSNSVFTICTISYRLEGALVGTTPLKSSFHASVPSKPSYPLSKTLYHLSRRLTPLKSFTIFKNVPWVGI